MIETVEIVNEDSPCGFVVINKCDMKKGDVVYGEKKKAGRPKKEDKD